MNIDINIPLKAGFNQYPINRGAPRVWKRLFLNNGVPTAVMTVDPKVVPKPCVIYLSPTGQELATASVADNTSGFVVQTNCFG
jgi:hypothetical protein